MYTVFFLFLRASKMLSPLNMSLIVEIVQYDCIAMLYDYMHILKPYSYL